MPEDDVVSKLEGRIAALENALKARGEQAAAEVTPEELAAFKKVRDMVAVDYGEFCGINDCYRCRLCAVCAVCRVCRVCRVCDVECSCGPCNVGGDLGGVGGFSRFGG